MITVCPAVSGSSAAGSVRITALAPYLSEDSSRLSIFKLMPRSVSSTRACRYSMPVRSFISTFSGSSATKTSMTKLLLRVRPAMGSCSTICPGWYSSVLRVPCTWTVKMSLTPSASCASSTVMPRTSGTV